MTPGTRRTVAPSAPVPPLPFETCQLQLALLWIGSSAVLFVLLMLMTAGGRFGLQTNKAWGWLLPNLLPTLSMIGGAIVYQMQHRDAGMTVTLFAFRTTWWLSVVYLLMILVTVLCIPLALRDPLTDPFVWLDQSRTVLTGLSAIVGAMLGGFFVSSRHADAVGGE